MSNLLSYRPSTRAVYYTSPRQWDPARAVVAITVAATLVIGLAIVAATVRPRMPPDEATQLTEAAAICLALLGMFAVRFGKVRAAALGAMIGFVLSVLWLLVEWIAWCYTMVNQQQHVFPLMHMILHPEVVWRLILIINRRGFVSSQGHITQGGELWFAWIMDALIVMGVGVLAPTLSVSGSKPECLECGRKCKPTNGLPRFAIDQQHEFLTAIESRQFAALASFAPALQPDQPELGLVLMQCPRCGKTNVLTVNRIIWRRIPSQGHFVGTTPLINQLLITPEEAALIKMTCARVQRRPTGRLPPPIPRALQPQPPDASGNIL